MAHHHSHRTSTSATTPTPGHPKISHMKRDDHPPLKKKSKYLKPSKKNRNTLQNKHGVQTPSGENDESESGANAGDDADSEEADDEEDDLPTGKASSSAGKPILKNKKVAGLIRSKSHENQVQDLEMSDADSPMTYSNVADETEFDIAEDDDNYDGVDGVSEVSDDSAAFEAEVENEIFAAGESAIDWDDKDIFSYSEIGLVDSEMWENEYTIPDMIFTAPPDWDFDALPNGIISPTIEPQVSHPVVEFHSKSWSPKLEIDWEGVESSASGSDSASDGTAAPSPADEASRRASNILALVDNDVSPWTELRLDAGQETDEDEPPTRTVSSPAVTLSRCNSQSTPGAVRNRLIDPSTPKRLGLKPPVKGKLKINPNKPIAVPVDGPRIIVFKTPKGSKMAWVDMRRFGSFTDDSAPSSPTMVDLDAALLEGNQRTGAAITDVIYGHMFRQYHCTDFDFTMYNQPTSHAEFSRVPVLNNGGLGNLFSELPGSFASIESDELADGIQPEMEALELIDFDGGAGDDEPAQPERAVTPERVNRASQAPCSTTPRARNKGKGKAFDSPNRSRVEGSSTPTRAARSTPDMMSSPLKRRAPTRSVSPSTKKPRVNAA